MDTKIKKIKSEEEFCKWFRKNFNKFGFDKIIKENKKRFPDFIMLKNNKQVKVELETLSSNFILHKHDQKEVDLVICIKENVKLPVETIEVKQLKYESRLDRISATVDKETVEKINYWVKTGKYRNKSHVIEDAIKLIDKKDGK